MSNEQVRQMGAASWTRGRRIVVVEDMGVVAMDIETTLTELGYEVPGVVATGSEAIECAERLRPDLVLMDINLPGDMDGVEAAEWIRHHLAIPVIFLTAYSDPNTLERAKVTEPYGYILKPIDKRELQANIEIALYRSHLERALYETEERYSAVVQQSSECILLVDLDGRRVLEANPAALRLLAYTAEEMEALTLYEILASEPEQIDQRIRRLERQGSATTEEDALRRSDGALVEVEVNVGLISYGGSRVLCTVARDITERRRAEEALRQAEHELEMQRTLSVRSDRLRSLGEMAAGIAHELSQPLVGVRGIAEYLLLGLERHWEMSEEQLREKLQQIIEQADRMVHIIDHVRMFSREAGKSDRSPVQVNEVVGAAMDLLRVQFQSRGVELVTELAVELPPVLANPFSLEEVVLNLLTNARDATESLEPGTPAVVTVRTRQEATTDGAPVVIEVVDNGPGIDPAIAAKIFQPFFTTKEAEHGTGLGLAISRSIVEQVGGRISLASELGRGTTVTVCLPSGA